MNLHKYVGLVSVIFTTLLFALPSYAQVSLAQPIETTLGATPNSVAMADLNADGRLDMAVVLLSTSKVVIVTNNGSGSYTMGATQYTVGTTPQSIAIGELTGDIYPDIAVANKSSNNVTVLKGAGDGTFTVYGTFAVTGVTTTASPVWLMIADMTNDGKNDIVTANNNDKSVSVLVNTGTSFTCASTSAGLLVGGRPTSLAVGDFNKDGKKDVAISTNLENSVKVMLGNNTGAFTLGATYAAGPTTSGISTADLNSDGFLDLVVANDTTTAGIQVLMGQVGGTFATAVRYPTLPGTKYAAIADLDWDGALDIIAYQTGTPDLSVFVNNGDGMFKPYVPFSTNAYTRYGMALGDMDNDGLPDVVMIESNGAVAVCNNLTPRLESIVLNPSTTAVGNAVMGQVNLNKAAPPEGAKVTLTCSNPNVINVPASFTVPAGLTSGQFIMAAQTAGTANVTGTFNRRSDTKLLTVTAIAPPGFWSGDVNKDGKVDITDVTFVVRMSGGLDLSGQ